MLNTILLSAAALLSCPEVTPAATPVAAPILGNPTITWEAPSRYIAGVAYPVEVNIVAPEDGSSLPSWLLTSAAFTIDGKSLTPRKGEDMIPLTPGAKLSLSFDLGPAIQASKGFDGKAFQLAFAQEYLDIEPVDVVVAMAAPKGLDFMKMPLEDLSQYQVIMSTNRGDMVMEFWPETAPNHVRNFLDLCYTNFYDDVIFHRVIPGFMIQGGDPSGTGSGPGRRLLDAEFTTDPKFLHMPGVLSMARTNDPNSASSQFFVMHKKTSHLDGKYSVFGKCIEGMEVVEAIVSTPVGRQDRPVAKQVILGTTVIVAAK